MIIYIIIPNIAILEEAMSKQESVCSGYDQNKHYYPQRGTFLAATGWWHYIQTPKTLFFLKKVNNLLHGAQWQAMIVTQGYYLSYERKEVYLYDAFLEAEGTWIDVMSHLDYDKRVYK